MKRGVSSLAAAALFAAQIAPALAQQSLAPSAHPEARSQRVPTNSGPAAFSRYEYEQCQTTEEAVFRQAIRTITLNALKQGTTSLDYNAIVKDQWRAGGLDAIIDQRVDIAVDQVRDETAWSELLKSLAYRKQAQELATAVAERTYRSDAIKAALEELATNVGNEIGNAVVLTTSDAAAPAQRCLQAYLGPRYGATVARSVNQDASAAFEIDPVTNKANISSGQVLLETSAGISGAILLLVRRQMTRMAQRIGQRVIGSILGRLVSVTAGGVGIVLIAKEFWELRHGILPIIANEMKSADSKEKVRTELSTSINEQINAHLGELADRTADKIVDIWHDFRRAHAKVIQLAEQDATFKAFLDTARPAQLPRLDEIVALVLEKEGPDAIADRLQDGTLHVALNLMPEPGMQIARELKSLPAALDWTALAGEEIDKVLKFGIHKRTAPETYSKAELTQVVRMDDPLAINRLSGLDRSARTVLLELEKPKLIALARTLTETELATLSSYLTGLSANASQRVLRMIANSPAAMRSLASARVRDGILSSRNQNAAVGMMLSDAQFLDVMTVARHVEYVWNGEVHPILLWEKHPVAVIGAGFVGLIILLMLRSLLFGRRSTRKRPSGEQA